MKTVPDPLWVGPWVVRFLKPEDRPYKHCRYLLYRETANGIQSQNLEEIPLEITASIVELFDIDQQKYIDIYK